MTRRAAILACAFLLALVAVSAARAHHPATASFYGPGLYGNGMGCGGTLHRGTWGVAHKTLPCGARLEVCYRGRCTRARVIDRGPYVRGRELDLTTALAGWLCRCSWWGVRTVRWQRLSGTLRRR